MKLLITFLAGGIAGAFLSAWSFELIFPTPAIQHWPRHDRINFATSPWRCTCSLGTRRVGQAMDAHIKDVVRKERGPTRPPNTQTKRY